MTGRVFGACALVRNPAGLFLTVTRGGNPDDLALPGGHVEPGEHPADAARRELHEETGLASTKATFLYEGDDGAGNVAHAYILEVVPGVFRPEPGLSVQWVTRECLLDRRNTFAAFYRGMFAALDERQARFAAVLAEIKARRPFPQGPVPGRAETDEQKQDIAARLLAAWRRVPDQRLGQMLFNAIGRAKADHPDGFPSLIHVEDEALVEVVEAFADRHARPSPEPGPAPDGAEVYDGSAG